MRFTLCVRETIAAVQKIINNDLNIVTTDRYVLNVKAGSGGSGIPRYNGVGGKGGDVYFVAKPNMAFIDIKKKLKGGTKIRAACGGASQKTNLIGRNGGSTFVDVPVGVDIVDTNQNTLIARCSRAFQQYIVARGGEGGVAENSYKGAKGDHVNVTIHLKLRPNVGLLGFPNAGKSTLLKAFIPEKSIKIAPYPFTTVNPQIGFWSSTKDSTDVVPFESKFTLSIADLPGIIEGASRNRGRGYQFLKHLEFADVILMVVDCTGFQLKNELDCPHRSPLETIALLNCEVENFNSKLAKKPVICVLNKIDLLDEQHANDIQVLSKKLYDKTWVDEVPEEMRPRLPFFFDNIVRINAKSGEIEEVKKALSKLHHCLRPLKDVELDDEDSCSKNSLL